MEKSDLREFSGITKIFSNFIIQNKIPTDNYLESFNQAFFDLVKTQKLGELKELVLLYHYVNKHQDSFLKLECNIAHCIECYNDIVNDENYMKNITICTCNTKIAPNFRKKIFDNFERIQKLKAVCIICGEKKDIMNFMLKNTHDCLVCNKCIIEKFDYNENANACRHCRQEFNEECVQIIRPLIEVDLPKEVVREYYSAVCPQCGVENDRREFTQTCKTNECLACKKCVAIKSDQKDIYCFCGVDITILQ